jgi:GLPGLI family protein
MNKYIILFLFPIFVFGQVKTLKIDYHSVEDNLKNQGTLIVEGDQGIYYYGSLNIRNEKIAEYDELSNTISVGQKNIKIDSATHYFNFNSDILMLTKTFRNKKVLVRDSIPASNWNINYKETKKINNFNCKKATTVFRGSSLVAWYTESIPIPAGPWKFNGLPGVILEVYNINDPASYIWRATKITFPYKNYLSLDYDKKLNIITNQIFIEDLEAEFLEQMKQINSRMPQGVTTTSSEMIRVDLEKIFEWETTDEKK